MGLKSRAVQKLDQVSPRLIGNLRYHLHVSLRRQIVFPTISKTIYARLDARDSTAIDVGANVGIFTRYLARHFGAVMSVEPVPYLADRLRRSAPRNCRVIGKALGDREGEVTLRIPRNAEGREMHALSTASASNALSMFAMADLIERTVPVTTLDMIARDAGNVAFVKIDVEGYEGAVLSGAPITLARTRPLLQLEIGRAHNPDYMKILELLRAHDYEVFALQDDGLHSDPVRYIEAQPLTVSEADAAGPQGCWDYLCVPLEKTVSVTAGLIR